MSDVLHLFSNRFIVLRSFPQRFPLCCRSLLLWRCGLTAAKASKINQSRVTHGGAPHEATKTGTRGDSRSNESPRGSCSQGLPRPVWADEGAADRRVGPLRPRRPRARGEQIQTKFTKRVPYQTLVSGRRGLGARSWRQVLAEIDQVNNVEHVELSWE